MTVHGMLAITALAVRALLIPPTAIAQTDLVPSTVAPAEGSGPLISRHTATVGGLLFAWTLLGDGQFRDEAQEFRGNTTDSFARIGNVFSGWSFIVPALSASYLAGEIAGSSELKGTALRAGLAVALATGLTTGLKYTIGRVRPGDADTHIAFRPFSGPNSFPSGHTTAAFALATAVADQTRDGWSDYVLYGAATLTALARINDNRHWVSDVLVGGLIGHFSARHVGRRMGPVQVAPTGMSVQLQF